MATPYRLADMSTDFGKRIKAARKHAKLTQKDLAVKIDMAQPSLSHLENQGFASAFTVQIAEACGVNPGWLATGEGAMLSTVDLAAESNVSPVELRARVPVINWVQAGDWSDIEPHFDLTEYENWHEIYNGKPSSHAFALVVEGDSMTSPHPGDRSFPAGTIIVVDPERGASAGDYVVAKDVATQRATFKRLAYDAGRWYLKPLNPAYPTIEIDDPSIRVIGRVVEFSISGVL